MASRYWEVKYLKSGRFKASGKFYFNLSNGLDNDFNNIQLNELLFLYRKNKESKWQIVKCEVEGRRTKGYFHVSEILPGEYTFIPAEKN